MSLQDNLTAYNVGHDAALGDFDALGRDLRENFGRNDGSSIDGLLANLLLDFETSSSKAVEVPDG